MLFGVRPPLTLLSSDISDKPVIDIVSKSLYPSLSSTKLCNTMQAFTILTANSGCTLIGR